MLSLGYVLKLCHPSKMTIHPIVVQFQSGPKRWADQLTHISIPRATPLARLKANGVNEVIVATIKHLMGFKA